MTPVTYLAAVSSDERDVAVVARDHCPMCGMTGPARYTDLQDRFFHAPGRWSFRECGACRHLWLDPAPAPEELPKLYTEYYTHTRQGPDQEGPALDARLADALALRGLPRAQAPRVGYMRWLAAKLACTIPPVGALADRVTMYVGEDSPGRLLEVGCGDGRTLARLQSLGWKVQGIEPDRRAARIARMSLHLEVDETTLENAQFGEGQFDAIIMSHVIEHLEDPTRALRTCWRWLDAGGRMVVVTPNLDSLGHATFGPSWMHLDPPRHLHIFSPHSLGKAFLNAGLAIPDLRTSSTFAFQSFGPSRRLRSEAATTLAGGNARSIVGGCALQFKEWLLELQGEKVGEELIATARKA